MEELKAKFDTVNKEQKIGFMKLIIPEMCKLFGEKPEQIINEIMPLCQDMMKDCNIDMSQMMTMMNRK